MRGLNRRSFITITVAGATTAIAGCESGSPMDDDSFGGTGDTGTFTNGSTTQGLGGSSSGLDESSSTGDIVDGSSSETGDEPITNPIVDDRFAEIPYDSASFPLAIMAGEMKTDSFLISTLVEDGLPKRLRVWRELNDGQAEILVEQMIEPGLDGYTKVKIQGLDAGDWYRYAMFDPNDDSRSVIGRVRTAPPVDSLEPLTVAITACNGDAFDWPALERTIEHDYDVFMHLGDMAYNDGARSLAEYRLSWRDYIGHETFKNVLANTGMYHTWDDHEIDDNSNFDPETMDPDELKKRQNAMDAFFELLPTDAEGPDYRLWRSFQWGRTAEILLLDCRYERRPSQGLYMSPAQMSWLKTRLRDSSCHFKIIMNSVPITEMPLVWDIAIKDRWEGYPGQRDELLNFIDSEGVDNVWFLAGDFHVCFVSKINADGDRVVDQIREVAITGGNTNPLFGNSLFELIADLDGEQFDLGNGIPSAVFVRFDPIENTMNVRFIDGDTGEEYFNRSYVYGE